MADVDLTFPLVPRVRLLGLPFGTFHSKRRGIGSDVAGTRQYVPGDDVGAIDWRASARLSSARDSDEFIVRDRFADEAPRVVVLCDRRPAMALYPPGFPWLRKAEAMRVVVTMIAASAARARSPFGYLDLAEDEPFWNPPTSEPELALVAAEYGGRPFSATRDNVQRGLEFLRLARVSMPPGSFVFVCSDYLVESPPDPWLAALDQGWEVVPVVVQDPTWEQSFPDVSGVTLPVVEAESGSLATMRLRRSQATHLRLEHERRLRTRQDELAALGAEPVVVGTTEPGTIWETFMAWADRRTELLHTWQLSA